VVVAVLGAATTFVLALKPRGATAAQWKRTTIELPQTWRGAELTRVDGQMPFGAPALGAGRALVGSYRIPPTGGSGADQLGGAAYGGTAVVMASKFGAPMSEANQTAFRKGFARSWRMMGIDLEEADPGQLGGWMGCGTGRQSTGGLTVCMATDASGYVVTMFDTSFTDAPGAARELREATVRR
jgi:hypothetical protein